MKKHKNNNKDDKENKDNCLDCQNKYLRLLADYHNLDKRINDQIDNAIKKEQKRLINKVIDILDQIEQAEIFVKDEGLKLIKNNIKKDLEQEKVKEMDLINKVYDPYVAECVEIVEGKQDNMVKEVVKKGYYINNTILRIAKVKVTKKM